jgi:hypothetical protein
MPRQLAGVYDLNYLASAFSTCSTTFGPSHILHFLLYRSDSSLGFTNYVYKKFCRFPGDTTQVIKPQNSYKFSRGSSTNTPRSERYLTTRGVTSRVRRLLCLKCWCRHHAKSSSYVLSPKKCLFFVWSSPSLTNNFYALYKLHKYLVFYDDEICINCWSKIDMTKSRNKLIFKQRVYLD